MSVWVETIKLQQVGHLPEQVEVVDIGNAQGSAEWFQPGVEPEQSGPSLRTLPVGG